MNKKFICASKERCTFEKNVSAPYFRKNFKLEELPQKAEISICGLGFYVLYINGINITKGALAPYISNPDHFCYYDTYDVTEYLNTGQNVIGIVLGNGFYNPFAGAVWNFDKADWINAPCVALNFDADGKILFEADESFKTHSSPIIFDELRMGEHYDANKEVCGWNTVGFNDSEWDNAYFAPAPRGKLTVCEAEPIEVIKEIEPVNIFRQDNDFVYDFGENNAGVCTLKIKAYKGQRIELWHGEIFANGLFDNYSTIFDRTDAPFYPEYSQKDVYIAKGEGIEEYTPKFTYHGFRYVLVKGITEEQATKELLTYNVMSSDLDEIGGFNCSDETINTLFEMVKRSDRSNYYYFPTDCPHREKNGWTGDISMSADHMIMLYDIEKSSREWMKGLRAAQIESGQIPVIVPTSDWGYDWGTGPAWDSVLFNLPYLLYKIRGCTDIVKENSHAMVRYLDYILTKRNENGTISYGLGDWCPVGKAEHQYNVPLEFTDTVMVMDMARKASEMLSAIGKNHQAAFAKNVYDDFRRTIRNELLDKKTMTIKGNSQSGQAMALYYGVFEKEEEQQAFDRLLEIIEANDNNFDSGFLGLHVLFHVLSEFGQSELAYKMIVKKEFPSYAYLIERGETTLVEMLRDDNYRRGSHNHHFFGDIARWFITRIAGLNVIDSKTVQIKPNFIENLDHASAYYELPTGKISVSWKRAGCGISLSVDSVDGIEYDIILPDGYNEVDGLIVKL